MPEMPPRIPRAESPEDVTLPSQRIRPSDAERCPGCGTLWERATDDGSDLGCAICLLRIALGDDGSEGVAEPIREEWPEQLGPFTLVRREDGSVWELGRGAMGVTLRARDESLQRAVALKITHPEPAAIPRSESAAARERFLREARVAASLRHPHVATVFHFGVREETGQCFYAMELVEGETLEERLRRTGPLDARTVVAIAAQVADALVAAEARGLVHRDLKPANLMLVTPSPSDASSELTVKVIDFGLAKAFAEKPDGRTLTHHGGFVGTPAFASPEQFAERPVDARSDVFSLGVTLWYLLTARLPFAGTSVAEIGASQRAGGLPLGQLRAARVPARLVTLLTAMLALTPAARPSAGDLTMRLARLRVALENRRRRTARQLVLGFGALAMLAAAAFHVFRADRPASGADKGSPTAVTAVETDRKSVAVLPFANDGDSRADAYFARGIQDELLLNLAKISELKVIARSSVLPYGKRPLDVHAIGSALGVATVLDGSVQRLDDGRMRVQAHLLDTATGREIWSESFDRETADAFAFQSDLAFHIARALLTQLTPADAARLRRRPTESGAAYLLFIQANDLFGGYEKLADDLKKAEALYEQAIALDPTFALAFARLSQLETIFFTMHDTVPARRDKARAMAREALRLQPDLPEAHLALGTYLWQTDAGSSEADYAAASQELAIAQRGLPNNAEVLGSVARVQRHQGRWAESTANLEKAAALDPNNRERWHRLFYNYEATRDFPAAARALDRVLALAPRSWPFAYHRAWLDVLWHGDAKPLANLLIRAAPAGGYESPGPRTESRFQGARLLREHDTAEKILLADGQKELIWDGVPGVPRAFLLGLLYLQMGEETKARAAFADARPTLEALVRARPLEAARWAVLAKADAGRGRKDDAIREARRATEILPEAQDPWFGLEMLGHLALVYAWVGEPDLALPLIAHSLSKPGGMYAEELRLDPAWDALRGNSRFQQLIETAGANSKSRR